MANQLSTKALVCKCVSLVLILLTLALISASYDRGGWYHVLESEEQSSEQACLESSSDAPIPCPPGVLIILSISITSISLVLSIASVIISFVMDTNQEKTSKIDFYLNLASGILLFLAGCLAFVFIRHPFYFP